jgi:hypothetical protein
LKVNGYEKAHEGELYTRVWRRDVPAHILLQMSGFAVHVIPQ